MESEGRRFVALRAFGAVCTTVLLGAFALLLVQAQVRARDDLEQRFELRTKIASSFISVWMDDFARREAADAAAELDAPTPGRQEFEDVVRSHHLTAAVLLDKRGRLLQVWPRSPDLLGTNLSKKYAHLNQALRGRRSVSNVVPSAVEGIPVVAVAVPFETPNGRRVFSGAFAISETPIGRAYLRNVTPIVGARSYLIDAAANPLGSSLDAPGEVRADDADLFADLRSGRTGTFVSGEDIATVEVVDGTPWRMVVVAPSSELFKPITGWSLWAPWVTFSALVVAVGAVWWLFEKLGRSRRALSLANAELVVRNDEIELAVAAQRRFISAASHELRTPLTSILGYLELLQETQNAEEREQALEVIGRNAKRLYRLVDSLMLVFRSDVDTFAKDEVDFRAVVVESVEAAMPSASSKRVNLQLRGDSRAPMIGDRERLAQAVDNLVSNSIKYSREGGRVEVALGVEDSKIRMQIADQGIGIPADELNKMFERFFRARTARNARVDGTGLGLPISRAIIEKHGGCIDVSSVEGEGTTFTVELPLAKGESADGENTDSRG